MDSVFNNLLFYTQIRWLSKGKVVEFILLRMKLLFVLENKI